MKTLSIAVGAMALGLAAGPVMAQSISPADKTFATNAASGGQAEVTLGQLAVQNATSPEVKAFGQRMVTDHTQANQALLQIAQQKGLTIPNQPDAADRTTAERLKTMKGPAFDRAYMSDMVQDHQKDVAEFRQEAETGTDPALKAFAQKYLPVLQQHLQMAENANPK